MADVRVVELHEFVTTGGGVLLIGGYSPDPDKLVEIERIIAGLREDPGAPDDDKLARYQRRSIVVEMPPYSGECEECGQIHDEDSPR